MFKTISYTLKINNLPAEFNNFRIAHLSDLHGQLWGNHNRELLKPVFDFRPHVIAMTGDMAGETDASFPELFSLIKKLSSAFPVCYSLGNHEIRMSPEVCKQLLKGLKTAGAQILDNSCVYLTPGGSCCLKSDRKQTDAPSLKICGINIPLFYYKDPLAKPYRPDAWLTAEDIRRLIGPCSQKEPVILLAHNPAYFPSYAEWGADLTLSGHVHGGIVRLPFFGGVLSPDVSFFPKYDGGHFLENNRHLIVSRGLSSQFLPRINNPMELIFITLVS